MFKLTIQETFRAGAAATVCAEAVGEVELDAVPEVGGDVGDGVVPELVVGAGEEAPFDPGEAVELVFAPVVAVVVV